MISNALAKRGFNARSLSHGRGNPGIRKFDTEKPVSPAFGFAPRPVAPSSRISPPEPVAAVLDALWGGDETLIVISSDLSHFHDYDTARKMDSNTSDAIVKLQTEQNALQYTYAVTAQILSTSLLDFLR